MPPVFCWFKSCPIVNGYKRDVIYDLNRNDFAFIPKSLTDFIRFCEGRTKAEINRYIKHSEYQQIYTTYIDFIFAREFAFYSIPGSYMNFTEYSNEQYDIPYPLKTIVIAYHPESCYNQLIRKADGNHIPSLSFDLTHRSFSAPDIIRIFTMLADNYFHSINFKLTGAQIHLITTINGCLSNYPFHIFIYLPFETDTAALTKLFPHIQFRQYSDQGVNPSCDFIVHYDFYFEAIDFNPFYYKKMYINYDGYISFTGYAGVSVGHIKSQDINYTDLLKMSPILWHIPKSKIKDCCMCEFRLMCCTANMAEEKGDGWVLSKACNYDPYTMTWQ